MVAVQTEGLRIDRKYLRSFPRDVATMVIELVNTYGVRYRLQDGKHIILYSPDAERGSTSHYPTKKISAERPAEQSLRYLEQWVAEAVTPHLIAEQASLLAERFNDPSKKPKRAAESPADVSVAQDPAPEPPAPEIEPEQATGPTPTEVLAAEQAGAQAAGRVPVEPKPARQMSEEERERRVEIMRAAQKVAVRNRRIRKAVNSILETTGVTLDPESAKKDKRIEKLEAELARVTRERDDYKARVDLIRDGLKL